MHRILQSNYFNAYVSILAFYESPSSTHNFPQRDRCNGKDFKLPLKTLLLAIVREEMLGCVKQTFNVIWILYIFPFLYLICKVAA